MLLIKLGINVVLALPYTALMVPTCWLLTKNDFFVCAFVCACIISTDKLASLFISCDLCTIFVFKTDDMNTCHKLSSILCRSMALHLNL